MSEQHVLLMPPHPGGVYVSSALCSCGDWQWDGDAIPLDYRAVLRDHTQHIEAASPGTQIEVLRAALERLAQWAETVDRYYFEQGMRPPMTSRTNLREMVDQAATALSSTPKEPSDD